MVFDFLFIITVRDLNVYSPASFYMKQTLKPDMGVRN